MLSLETFKKTLGKTADEMTDEQILELREHQDKMAEIFFCMWLKNISKDREGVYN